MLKSKESDNKSDLLIYSLNHIHEAIYLIDKEARINLVNDEACRLLGYTREELLTMKVGEIDPDYTSERWPQHWNKLKIKKNLLFESTHWTKDGYVIPVEINANYFEYAGGKYNLALVRDISKRKVGKKELETMMKSYQTLIENIPDLIVRYNTDLHRTYVNHRWEKASGLSAGEVINKYYPDIPRVPYQTIKDYERKLRFVIKTGEPQTTSFTWVNADGKTLYLEYSIVPEFDKNGKTVSLICIGHDITERSIHEHEIISKNAELSSALTEKVTLIRELFHRTRNTLQLISSLLYLQTKKFADNKDIQILVEIMEQRIQSISLVHEMLFDTRNVSQISLREYIKKFSDLIFQKFMVSYDKISLDLKLDDLYLIIDTAIPLGLILNELMTNSIKYAFPENRKGIISISLTCQKTDKNMYVLQYSDNGVGLPDGFVFRNQDTLGFNLIYILVENQMNGTVSLKGRNGLTCLIKFPSNIYHRRF